MAPLETMMLPVMSFALPVASGSKVMFKLDLKSNFVIKSVILNVGLCMSLTL